MLNFFHAVNATDDNYKKTKIKKQGKHFFLKAYSAVLFQVPLRKGEYILYSQRTTRVLIMILFFFFSNTILPTFRIGK